MYTIFRDVCFAEYKHKYDLPIPNINTSETRTPREWLPIENYPSQADLHAVWIAIDKMFSAASIADEARKAKHGKHGN